MTDKQPLNREQIAAIVAQNFQRNWIVNFGFGIPTLASNFVDPDSGIMLTAENGLLGYGKLASAGYADYDVVNAGLQCVTRRPGAAVVHHADSFALIHCAHGAVSGQAKPAQAGLLPRPLRPTVDCATGRRNR